MATKKTNDEMALTITLPKIETGLVELNIVGDSPLIVHRWVPKAKQEILDKHMKKAKSGRDAKVPLVDFAESLYFLDENLHAYDEPSKVLGVTSSTTYDDILPALKKGKYGFPTVAFKSCALDAGYQQGVIAKKTTARGAFFIIGELAVIEGIPTMREDMVQVGAMSKTADIRYRAEFREWKTKLLIQYNKKAITPEQIANLLNYGGFSNGVGEWRPEKDGLFGRFHVGA